MLRVAIDARLLGHSGLGRYTESIVKELLSSNELGKSFCLFLVGKSELISRYIEVLEVMRNKVFILEDTSMPFTFKSWFSMRMLLLVRRHKISIVHFPHINVPLFCFFSFVITLHDLIPLSRYAHYHLTNKMLFVLQILFSSIRAKKIICVSNFASDKIRKVFPFLTEKIVRVYPRVFPVGAALSTSATHDSTPYFLMIGNIRPHKNIEFAIRAFQQFSLSYPGFELRIIGREHSRVGDFEVPARVRFLGAVTDEELFSSLLGSTALLFPSLEEGFGIPPIEAAFLGVPTLSCRDVGHAEIFCDPCLSFDSDSLGGFVASLCKLANCGVSEASRLYMAARVEFFSQSRVSELLTVYQC